MEAQGEIRDVDYSLIVFSSDIESLNEIGKRLG